MIPITLMNLKGIMPSKGSQSQKITSMVSFICHSEKDKTRDRDQVSGCQGLGQGRGSNHMGNFVGDGTFL